MTNHPRYSPPPPPQGRRPGDDHTAVYPPGQLGVPPAGRGGHTGYQQQQPYAWRYATQQQQQAYRQAYDPYRGAPQQPHQPVPSPRPPQKRWRAGPLTAGALAVAGVSAGIGRGVALVARPDRPAGGTSITAAPSVPAAS